ncbi:beta-ketoacyl-ACP synthase III [Streptomyces melanogenes]|uniref:beta-ketoacyl-ACP synthase III n=1 Tax=Streptomyces melanogenes TaxID=67326 RepID=UPI00167E2055|nr:beta-ketoacyl-ACP synthase III [Streptomyces melanogenes]GGP94679.1 3-oxoacyl-[acyl-carrier-protein] synthase 3 protein 5 [Streptomyces melanogenes]
MTTLSRAAVVAGLGAYVPPRVVTNDDLAAFLDTDDEWIRTRTGIAQRHVIEPGEATSDLAVEAGRRALASAGTRHADAVVVATSTPDRPCPATAPDVAARLGLGHVPAFDVAAVCTGFVYALATAAGFIAAGTADTVLVIGADTFSTILDPSDRTTRAVFGDGAGAMLLRAGTQDEQGALCGLRLGSDGSRSELIEVPGLGSRTRSTGLPIKEEDTYFTMQGRAVFSEAVQRMSTAVTETAQRIGWSLTDIDRFVFHQANSRILAAIAERLEVPAEKLVSNIERVGNTVAASIPLALADSLESGGLEPGHRVVLAGFGGGLTWGSVALTWPDTATA